MSQSETIYELTIPRSSPDALRVGIDEESGKVLVEFGFFKEKGVVLVDVRKELDVEMAENLLSHLQSALEELTDS